MAKINDSIRKQLAKILFWQLVIVVGLTLVTASIVGIIRGYSTFIGGVTYWIPTSFYLWRVSAHAGARAAMRFMVAFFAGEIIKLCFSAALFILAVKYLGINEVYGVMGLIGSIIAFWIASVSSLFLSGDKIA